MPKTEKQTTTTSKTAKPTKPAMKRLTSNLEGDGFLTPGYADIPLILHGATPCKRYDQKSDETQHGYTVEVEIESTSERLNLTTYASVLVKTLDKAVEENMFPVAAVIVKPDGKRYYVFGE